jgi:hypothetical protein
MYIKNGSIKLDRIQYLAIYIFYCDIFETSRFFFLNRLKNLIKNNNKKIKSI